MAVALPPAPGPVPAATGPPVMATRRSSAAAELAVVGVTALAPLAWGTTYVVTTELLPSGRPLLAGTLRALPAGLALVAVTRQRPVGAWWAN